jgi:predicted phosphodiesterase
MSDVSEKRVEEILDFYAKYGEAKTLQDFNIKQDTLARYIRKYKKTHHDFKLTKTLLDIKAKYTEQELNRLAKGHSLNLAVQNKINIDFSGEKVKMCFMTDLHAGGIYFNEENFDKALKVADEENVDMFVLSGDITEGMSNRPGHVYELTHIGYDQQKEYAVHLLSKFNKKCYCIDGNHDRWYIKSNGAIIVKDICKETGHEFLGHDEGDIVINNSIIKLWHGLDGSSYATSYRVQKLIEALTGGEKPNVLLCGHTHKQGYFFERHVHAISGGAMSRQSSWMRGKKLANHYGFHIIELTINNHGVARCKVEWFPFYQ